MSSYPGKTISLDTQLNVGSFTLKFFGGTHALIHSSIPQIVNFGVLINEKLYYPGDSFALPDQAVDTLALPAAAPWMKLGEAMDFLEKVKPRLAFPTHDALLSKVGKTMVDSHLNNIAQNNGGTYQRITSTIEI